jgi:OmcA/MtrC family decaheme c-type cytochrome
MKSTLVRLGFVVLMIGTLAGCGGGGGGDNTPPPGPGPGPGPGPVTPTVPVPSGNAPVTLTPATPAATFAALAPVVVVGGVSVNSPPCVAFSIADKNNNGIIGFGSTSQSATATLASYPNLAFALAKLIPGTNNAPSRWVSYIVTTVPTKNATTGAITASVPTRPSTDNTGTLTDNKNGTYLYCFYRDVKAAAAQVAAATLTAPNVAADLDDLTFDPNAVHRLTIQVSGNAPGTGTNTPNGVQATPGVPMANPVNAIFDFIPATGKQVTASGREITATANCNQCHQNLGGFPTATAAESDATFHGGNRNNVQYCVVCHTEQRKYGQPEAATVTATNGAINYDGVDATGAPVTTGKGTYRINGLAVGKLGSHIHKIHMSQNLTKIGYNYGGVIYETACKFPQDIRNCTKCHDGSANAATSKTGSVQTAQGDNWMTVPNRSACGACHDGINFVTGKGVTLADAQAGLIKSQFGHVGGSQPDDSACVLCHKGTDIATFHIPVTPPSPDNSLLLGGTNNNTNAASIASNTDRLPAGAIKVSYEIQSVSRNASKRPVMVFRLLQNGTAVPFKTPSATQTEIWDNFMGAPSVYFVFAVPQDNTTAPADFNASTSAYLRTLWNGNLGGTPVGTLTGPDANGFYTATLTTVTIPDNAVMLTGGLGYSYNVKTSLPLTQTNLPDYPVAAATGTGLTAGMPNKTGGLVVIAPDAQMIATGYTGRRPIVEDARCNKCHLELGPFTEDAFHAGQRNDGTTCSWCHNPNQNNGGWSGDSTYFVHGIHAAAKRAVPFTWHAASATDGFYNIGYPGILNNCETCHVPGTYDFSAAASSAALSNRLYRATATGTTVAATFSTSPYIAQTAGTVYGANFSFSAATGATVQAAGTTLVNSPVAGVCFSCHDGKMVSDPSQNVVTDHMVKFGGGSINSPRTTALATAEQCILCHGPNSTIAPIKAMHNK